MARKIPLIRISQWLPTWDEAVWADEDNLPKPDKHFFVGSMPIALLRRLSGVSRRQVEERKRERATPGYQRAHEAERSTRIGRYVQFGYPISASSGINPQEHRDLIHPGWLPTSILVNVLQPGDTRRRHGADKSLGEGQALQIVEDNGAFCLSIPDADASIGELEPLEIIDGQHRIFSVDSLDGIDESYEVPVVFFHGLTTSWQAYLFWVINVEPKKINPSLAFDLYPELRSQSWLERGEGLRVYQEHRAQEITESLWRHDESPWRQRIELLGNRVDGHVSNAAFIRTLMATFVRRWGSEHRIGGLFGSLKGDGREYILPWNRAQQIAFLIAAWRELAEAVKNSSAEWVRACRKSYADIDGAAQKKINPYGLDPAFAGPHTLLGTDQGVRAISYVFNAFCQVSYSDIGLEEWELDSISENAATDASITRALESLREQRKIVGFLRSLSKELVVGSFDWRTSKEPNLTTEGKLQQGSYRGSSGYKTLQENVIRHLSVSSASQIAEVAKQASGILGIA